MTQSSGQNPILPNEIVMAIAQFLTPNDIAQMTQSSKKLNEVLDREMTWALVARNLKIPVTNKNIKAQVIEYYQRTNQMIWDLVWYAEPDNHDKKFKFRCEHEKAKDIFIEHGILRQSVKDEGFLAELIKSVHRELKENPKDQTIRTFLDVLLDDWMKYYESPLRDGIYNNMNIELIEMLFNKGARDSGSTNAAATLEDPEFLKFLVNHKIEIGVNALFNAVWARRTENVKLLLLSGIVIKDIDWYIEQAKKRNADDIVTLLEQYK